MEALISTKIRSFKHGPFFSVGAEGGDISRYSTVHLFYYDIHVNNNVKCSEGT